jgi:hypothetical protein
METRVMQLGGMFSAIYIYIYLFLFTEKQALYNKKYALDSKNLSLQAAPS